MILLPTTNHISNHMKNLLLTLGVFSLFFFSSCGGGHNHDCCGECGGESECCGKCGGDKDGEKKSECCGEGGECCKSGDSK
jgi:hypothetical protein